MNDIEFLGAFERGHLHPFRHADHVRMAWLYLRQYGTDKGIVCIRKGLKHFATAHGAADKYHETITLFWVKLVDYARQHVAQTDDFEAFIAHCDHLLDTRLLAQHYSPARLASDMARRGWIEPDLKPLPQ